MLGVLGLSRHTQERSPFLAWTAAHAAPGHLQKGLWCECGDQTACASILYGFFFSPAKARGQCESFRAASRGLSEKPKGIYTTYRACDDCFMWQLEHPLCEATAAAAICNCGRAVLFMCVLTWMMTPCAWDGVMMGVSFLGGRVGRVGRVAWGRDTVAFLHAFLFPWCAVRNASFRCRWFMLSVCICVYTHPSRHHAKWCCRKL